ESRRQKPSAATQARPRACQRGTAGCVWPRLDVRKLRVHPMPAIARSAVLLACTFIAFTPPSEERIRQAIGDVSSLAPVLQRAFAPDASAFEPIPQAGPNDWLAVHPEPGQTFDQFEASLPNRPALATGRVRVAAATEQE